MIIKKHIIPFLPEHSGDVAELSSSYADYAFIETIDRMDKFLSREYGYTMSDLGIE